VACTFHVKKVITDIVIRLSQEDVFQLVDWGPVLDTPGWTTLWFIYIIYAFPCNCQIWFRWNVFKRVEVLLNCNEMQSTASDWRDTTRKQTGCVMNRAWNIETWRLKYACAWCCFAQWGLGGSGSCASLLFMPFFRLLFDLRQNFTGNWSTNWSAVVTVITGISHNTPLLVLEIKAVN
jgi:hypothetical protein